MRHLSGCCVGVVLLFGVALASAQTSVGLVSNLTATVQSPGGTVVHLAWEGAPNAEWHEVWRAAGGDLGEAEYIGTNIAVSPRFDDETTRAGVGYSYWVRGMS